MLICNKFYFGEVQEEVQANSVGRVYISAPRKEGLSVYQWSLSEKNKHVGWGNAFFKYSTEVWYVLEILENSKFIANELP